MIPITGHLLPEVAAQFQRICDAMITPRLENSVGSGPRFFPEREATINASSDDAFDELRDDLAAPDPRTREQKQHDALATALMVAAASQDLPTIGGSSATLVVSVREEDLRASTGHAHLDGVDVPVGTVVAAHVGCVGTIHRVVSDRTGRIVSLGISDRVFDHRQRKAIALRDGGCVIPGCHTPASWCELHHIPDWSRGGPTHTDHGVMLCWWHHRTIGTSGWEVRIRDGVPETRAPAWWDASRQWRATTKSKVRMLNRIEYPPPVAVLRE